MPPNLLKTGSEWLARQQQRHAAERVYYARNASVTLLPAVMGRSQFDIEQADGGMLHAETFDFIIRAEDLKLDDVPVEPAQGDRITTGILGTGQVYEVMALPGQPAFRYTDEYRHTFRIHCKHVEDETD